MFQPVILAVLCSMAMVAEGGILAYPGLLPYHAAPVAPALTSTSYRTQYHTQVTSDPVLVAKPVAVATYGPVAYSAVPVAAPAAAVAPAVAAVGPVPAVAPAYYATPVAPQAVVYKSYPALANQYHSQNHLGEAAYGYSFPGQAHSAVRDHTGGVTGSYSYVDAEGKPVLVNYRADSANGFQVSSNVLPVAPKVELVQPVNTLQGPEPVDFTPEVKAAREEHFKAVEEAKARAGSDSEEPAAEGEEKDAESSPSAGSRKKRSITILPAVHGLASYHYSSLAHPSFYNAYYPSYVAPAGLSYYSAPAIAAPLAGIPAPAYVRSIVEPLKPVEGKLITKYSFVAGDQNLLKKETEAASSE